MTGIFTLLAVVSALVVALHAINLAATMNVKEWIGHRFEFALVAAAESAVFSGAIGVAAGWQPGAQLLLAGVAGLILLKGNWHGYR